MSDKIRISRSPLTRADRWGQAEARQVYLRDLLAYAKRQGQATPWSMTHPESDSSREARKAFDRAVRDATDDGFIVIMEDGFPYVTPSLRLLSTIPENHGV